MDVRYSNMWETLDKLTVAILVKYPARIETYQEFGYSK